jgi:methylase of polypeptide subunit release factors
VVARPSTRRASDLRDIFGWSLPFDETLAGAELMGLLRAGGLVRETQEGLRTHVRVSRVRGRLFLHSAFPTDSDDSVFLGPDTMRFVAFVESALAASERRVGRLVDIGAGAGVGGILAGSLLGTAEVELADINPKALSYARVNAACAGVPVRTLESDGASGIEPGFDLAIANPPFILDEGGPAYRNGGTMLGTELSLRWTLEAAAKLAPGGRFLLYTGSAIVGGRDGLRERLEDAVPGLGCTLGWREIDPDIFGDELSKPAYSRVERIAAVGAVVEKVSAPPS